MKRNLDTAITAIEKIPYLRHGMVRGFLAEDYDGIGQYILVSLARSSSSALYKGRIAAGDFAGGRSFPAGTPVHIAMYRGQAEVHLGNLGGQCTGLGDFPIVAASTNGEGTDASPHTFSIPAVSGGELLIGTLGLAGNPSVSWPGDWTEIIELAPPDGSQKLGVAYKFADGSEGSTISVSSGDGPYNYKIFRITGHRPGVAPYWATATGDDTSPNPPNLNIGVVEKHLIIAVHAFDWRNGLTLSTYPYADNQYSDVFPEGIGGGGSSSLSSCTAGVEASSVNPGVFIWSGSDAWAAATIGIRPC